MMTDNVTFGILRDAARVAEYADVAWLAFGDNPGPVTPEFIAEIHRYVANAQTQTPQLTRHSGLAFALTQGDRIIGTAVVHIDGHFDGVAQLNHFAISPAHRGHHYGRRLLDQMAAYLKSHFGMTFLIWSTVTSGPYYESIGMPCLGRVTADGYTRLFYGTAL